MREKKRTDEAEDNLERNGKKLSRPSKLALIHKTRAETDYPNKGP